MKQNELKTNLLQYAIICHLIYNFISYLNLAVSGSSSRSSLIGDFGTFVLNCSVKYICFIYLIFIIHYMV